VNREMQFNLPKKPQTSFSVLGSGIFLYGFFISSFF